MLMSQPRCCIEFHFHLRSCRFTEQASSAPGPQTDTHFLTTQTPATHQEPRTDVETNRETNRETHRQRQTLSISFFRALPVAESFSRQGTVDYCYGYGYGYVKYSHTHVRNFNRRDGIHYLVDFLGKLFSFKILQESGGHQRKV